jgi:hypothetical protein
VTTYATPNPGANRVPIADGLGKLDPGWLPPNTAANSSITDTGDYFVGTDVEAALQELGLKAGTVASVALAPGAQTLDSVLKSAVGDVEWSVNLVKGNERYSTTIRAVHDNISAFHTQNNVVLTAGTIDVTLDVDISGTAFRLRATAGSSGWAAHIRRHTSDA